MEQKEALIYSDYLFLLLLSISPFMLSATDMDKAEILQMNIFPPIVSTIASNVRWGLFILIIIHCFWRLKQYFRIIDKSFLWIMCFYGIQMLYAFVTNTDVTRYIGLTIMSACIPFFICITLLESRVRLILYARYIIFFLVIFSIVFNFSMILHGSRFMGFINNPNLYGMTAVFWLSILFISIECSKKNRILTNVFTGIIFLTILLSGSRGAMGGAIIVVLFQFRTNLKGAIAPLIILVFSSYFLLSILDLDIIVTRLLNVDSSISDSGRIDIWNRAFVYIKQDFYWGYGMNANMDLIGSGNMHNCYIRYILNMGIVFTILSFSFYVSYLVKLIKNISIIPASFIGFIFAFVASNFGEDYFVGLGSSVLIYANIVIGLIAYYLTLNNKSNDITR